jgi:hypothetical protein
MSRIVAAAFFLVFTLQLKGQQPFISRIDTAPVIDGLLSDELWQSLPKLSHFTQHFPGDSLPAKARTEVMLACDGQYLYAAAICYSPSPQPVVQSLKRDFDLLTNDNITFYLDPFDDRINGFVFSLSALGVQSEGAIQTGGGFGPDLTWDHIWFGEVSRDSTGWYAEIAIPLHSIRYKTGLEKWNINIGRTELHYGEESTWKPVPFNFNAAVLQFAGEVYWTEPLEKQGRNISLIPYASGGLQQDLPGGIPTESLPGGGMDAKIVLTPSLNLDLTINPDFSQVEVDDQVTNLSRFSLFFPEKRSFFIENSDLFSRFGFRQIRPFFSRRIGLNEGRNVPIYGGARLSGKLTKSLRIGAMSMQQSPFDESGSSFAGQNYSVAAFQQQVFGRSNIGAIFVNRQGVFNNSLNPNDFNRIAGIDYDIYTANNKLRGKIFYHHSFVPNNPKNADAHASWLRYETRNFALMWNHEYVGRNYDAQTGFVPRNKQYNPLLDTVIGYAYWRLEPEALKRFYPGKSSVIANLETGVYADHYLNIYYETTDLQGRGFFNVNLKNTAKLRLRYDEWFTKLIFNRDISFSGQKPLPADDYRYRTGEVYFLSDIRRLFNWEARINAGSYFTGSRIEAKASINYRVQPWGVFQISYTRNEIRLPQPYSNTYFDLVGAKLELLFSRNIFWSNYLQWNSQVDNLNINSRLQWRFRPMSDFFIVYTDNYDLFLQKKNRTLVLKLVYWINV